MNDPLDDLLDARLRDETLYIDDAGFTARVVKQMPRHNPVRTERSLVIVAAVIIAVVTAYFASGEGSFVHDLFVRIAGMPPLHLLIAVVASGIATTGSAFWAASNRLRSFSD